MNNFLMSKLADNSVLPCFFVLFFRCNKYWFELFIRMANVVADHDDPLTQ